MALLKIIKSLLYILILLCPLAMYAQVERIEPPNWWAGMKEPTLQIMLYGDNIGSMKPAIKYKGVKLIKSSSPGSSNYLFLDLEIKPNVKPGEVPITLWQGSQLVTTIQYPLLKREIGSSDRIGFNSSDAIYLITPDRFANGDPSNDQIEGMEDFPNRKEHFGRHGGDIQGVSRHLDYISSLGFTSIWLNPVLENNMPRHSYHGYAITDFYKVDLRFGSNESYRDLCKAAASKNLKVIMDMVVNHCGLQHWWMNDPPTSDWIHYHNMPYVETNHRKTLSTDPYAAESDKSIMTDGWFVRTMPDINVSNAYAGKYFIQNAIWWIEYAGLSGIRMDTYLYPEENYMSEWSRRIMLEYPQFNISGEVWHDNPAIVSYWQRGKENQNGYISYLPSLFDFPVQTALSRSLNSHHDWGLLYEMVAQDFQYPDPQKLVVFADNHDMSRLFTQVDEDFTKYSLALAYLVTTRGIPQVFYGTEILMANKGTDSHGVIRSDFPGGWAGDAINAVDGKGLAPKQKEAQNFIRKILNWRKTADVIHHGKMIHYVPENSVYVFFRYDENDKVMVILNKNEGPFTLSLDRFRSMIGASSHGEEIISGNNIKLAGELKLDHAGPMIIELK